MKKLICKIFKLYRPVEVRNMFLEHQYERAKESIGNRGKERTTPMEYYESHKKF